MAEHQTEDQLAIRARDLGANPAYSSPSFVSPQGIAWSAPGLTKRELIAAMAMQGLAPAYAQGGDFMENHVADGAVKLADALLRELAK